MHLQKVLTHVGPGSPGIRRAESFCCMLIFWGSKNHHSHNSVESYSNGLYGSKML